MSTEPGPLPRRGGLLTVFFLVAVGAAVIIAVLAFNFVGDGLRDAADPYVR